MTGIRFGLVAAALMLSAGAADAQRVVLARDVPPGHRPPPGECKVWIEGVPPGHQSEPTDCATAQARAATIPNARVIYGDDTPFPGRGRARARARVDRECRFERTRTATDVIFGRRDRDVECRSTGRREIGAWYEIGRDRNGNRIYQRRARLGDGREVLQRGRRARNGRIQVFDTRVPRSRVDRDGDSDNQRWGNAVSRGSNGRGRGRGNR